MKRLLLLTALMVLVALACANACRMDCVNLILGRNICCRGEDEICIRSVTSPNTDSTNNSGFSGLPGGSRYYYGPFNDVGNYGYWWSSTEYSSDNAWLRTLIYSSGGVNVTNSDKRSGFSVRCLRDN